MHIICINIYIFIFNLQSYILLLNLFGILSILNYYIENMFKSSLKISNYWLYCFKVNCLFVCILIYILNYYPDNLYLIILLFILQKIVIVYKYFYEIKNVYSTRFNFFFIRKYYKFILYINFDKILQSLVVNLILISYLNNKNLPVIDLTLKIISLFKNFLSNKFRKYIIFEKKIDNRFFINILFIYFSYLLCIYIFKLYFDNYLEKFNFINFLAIFICIITLFDSIYGYKLKKSNLYNYNLVIFISFIISTLVFYTFENEQIYYIFIYYSLFYILRIIGFLYVSNRTYSS